MVFVGWQTTIEKLPPEQNKLVRVRFSQEYLKIIQPSSWWVE